MKLVLFQLLLTCFLKSSFEQQSGSCGIRKLNNRELETFPGQFPWHVAIHHRLTQNRVKLACGGSLISQKFVLTADRCTRNESGDEIESDDFVVYMGVHDLLLINLLRFQKHSVEEIFGVSGDRWFGLRNDIALLKLAGRVEFNNYVQPVCIGSADKFVGNVGVVAGWGSRFLKTNSITINRKVDCSTTALNAGLICADSSNGTKLCNKDIGGGLIVSQNDDIYFLVGIATISEGDYKKFDCNNNTSFTDIQTYLPWIGNISGLQAKDQSGTKTCGQRKGESKIWPWHGSLHRRVQDESTYWCGVTILTEQFVLTVNLISVGNLNLNQFFVRFGQSAQQRDIENVFPHSRKALDLTLLKVKSLLRFSPEVQPICLFHSDKPLDEIVGRTGYVAGYGGNRIDQMSEKLKEFSMPIASARDCVRDHDRFTRLYVKSETFCAGLRNGTGPDFGDTGGGLFLEDGGKWFLKGVLIKMIPSKDYRTTLKKHFAIFADLTFYLSWINTTIEDNS